MNIWSYLKVSPILIPFIIGVYKYRDIEKFKYLFYFVCFGVATEITSKILKSIETQNTMPLSHLYTLVSFILLCLFFQSVFNGYIKKIWFRVVTLFFVIFCFVNLLLFQSIYAYPSLPFSILVIVMVTFSILYFHKTMVDAKIGQLSKESLIWINTGILIYYSGNLFYYILFNLFLDYSHEFLKSIGIYVISLNALFYILIAIGFWKVKKGDVTRKV